MNLDCSTPPATVDAVEAEKYNMKSSNENRASCPDSPGKPARRWNEIIFD